MRLRQRVLAVVFALVVGFTSASPCSAQEGYIREAPTVKGRASGSVAVLIQVEAEIGTVHTESPPEVYSKVSKNKDLGLGLGLHVRAGVGRILLNPQWVLMPRVRISAGIQGAVIPHDKGNIWLPIAIGPEIALSRVNSAGGFGISPYAAIQYGATVWINNPPHFPSDRGGRSLSGNPSWGLVLTAGADFSLPGLQATMLGISFTHRGLGSRTWESGHYWGSSDQFKLKYSQSQFKAGVSFPL